VHLKPAKIIVETTRKFTDTEVLIQKDEESVSAKSPINILGLELSHGSQFTITVTGGNENGCFEAIEEVLKKEFLIDA